jgi:hypothetical protein
MQWDTNTDIRNGNLNQSQNGALKGLQEGSLSWYPGGYPSSSRLAALRIGAVSESASQ